jgi:hypothetical protein
MLVYHFKERLITLEKKSERIMEVVNNLFKELTYQITIIKALSTQQSISNNNNNSNTDTNKFIHNNRLVVSESGDSDSEYESDYEEDSDENMGDDTDEIKHIQIHLTEKIDNNDIDDSIVELSDSVELIEVLEANDSVELSEPLETEDLEVDNNEIIVKKIELDTEMNYDEIDETDSDNKSVNINPVEVYRKMDIVELRALVIQQGLATDVKKVKKVDLIRLLTNTIE